jgi:hypothetical protein
MNRLYYAMFYAVSALALAHDFSTSSHAQMRGYFKREFVRTGRVPTRPQLRMLQFTLICSMTPRGAWIRLPGRFRLPTLVVELSRGQERFP